MLSDPSWRFLRFLITGGSGAVAYLAGSTLLTFAGMQPWLASFLVYGSLVPIVYTIQRRFVFRSGVAHSRSFPRYVAIQSIGLGLAAALPFLLEDVVPSPVVSFVIVQVVITFTNYVLQLRWAFQEGPP